MINWAVLGAGGIAERRTIPEGILPSPKANLVAVMDTNLEAAARVGQKYGVDFTSSEDKLLERGDVQAVYVASPNFVHKAQVIKAACAGKHVLVEKPLALTLADAEEMVTACQDNGVKLMVGYMMRFHAYHRALKRMIDDGRLGQLVFGRAQLSGWYPEIAGAWRQDIRLSGGGALVDMGSHCIDLLEFLMGPIKKVCGFSGSLTFNYNVDDATTALFEFANGAQGIVDCNFNVPDQASMNVLEIRGTGGAVYADHTIGQRGDGQMRAYLLEGVGGYDAAQERQPEEKYICIAPEPVNLYQAEIEHLCDCIEKQSEPIYGGKEAIRNLKIILAVYEAVRTGQVIDIE